MEPLKTLKGSRIWYSKFGVGKQVGSKIYFHKFVWDKIIPKDVWNRALEALEINKLKLIWFQTVCYDFKQPNIARFDTCPGFNLHKEPMVGHMFFVDVNTGIVTDKYNNQIYHHQLRIHLILLHLRIHQICLVRLHNKDLQLHEDLNQHQHHILLHL